MLFGLVRDWFRKKEFESKNIYEYVFERKY